MTDLDKLRSEFESDLAEHLIERDANGFYINCEIQHYWDKYRLKALISELKAELEKAKAQAVPEGYVLMPLEPTQEMLAAANLAPMPMVHIDSLSGREKLRISTQYKAMVNVCKSGAEG